MARAVFKPLEPLPDDTNEMKIAIDVLNRAFVTCERKTKWQLKIGNLSYYPDKGKICRDGPEKAFRERGLESLLRLVAEDQEKAHHIPNVGKPEVLDLSNLSAQEAPLPPGVLNMKQLSQKYGWDRS
jgi:hypothetical protein